MASYKNYSVGERVWVPHEEDAWVAGRIEKVSQTMIEISTERGVLQIRPASDPAFKYESCGSHIGDNVENLVDLDELSEGAILHHIRKRYKKRIIYTYVGSILVAVNPFEKLEIYSYEEIIKARSAIHLYPHVFVTASLAYKQLQTNGKNQSVLISGESGAGKTETTKKVLSFLSKVAPSSKPRLPNEPGIEDKILQSNPLLEALGNAKTLRNNNSSRFGKWMKIEFDKSFCMQGCEIINYLLEKSRVVHQSKDERNYHIFYQLLATKDQRYRSQFRLKSILDYHYLSQSGCENIPGVSDLDEFSEVLSAMQTLQFPSEMIDEIFQVLVIVLNLGNFYFLDGPAASSSGEPTAILSRPAQENLILAAELLGIESPILLHSLTEKVIQVGKNSMVSIKLNRAQAEDSRDNLAKAIYSNLFDWIIKWVNTTLQTTDETFYSIGILDIFGFEVFTTNSFEQLCINYANEKLQFHFNEVIFREETQMYLSEGISLEKVVFEDNSECVNLVEGKPFGIFSLLDEECSLGKATDTTFINKLEKTFGVGKQYANSYFVKHRTKQDIFSIRHFAGGVEYNVKDFLEKNRDAMSTTTLNMLKLCQTKLIQLVFDDSDSISSNAMSSDSGRLSPQPGGVTGKSQANQSNKMTLGGKFRGQLIGLVNNLYKTEPHFIRCVKPNHNKAPQQMDGQLTLRQLRYAGLFEAIRIRKSGYAYRATHEIFANTYQIIVDDLRVLRLKGKIDNESACRLILETMSKDPRFPSEVWAIGTTKVFLKGNIHRTYLEQRKNARVFMFAIAIQSLIRGYFVRAKYRKVREAWISEKRRLAEIAKRQYMAATVIQKNIRRYLVMSSLVILRDLIRLRRYVKRQDTVNIKLLVKDIEEQVRVLASGSSSSPPSLSSNDPLSSSLTFTSNDSPRARSSSRNHLVGPTRTSLRRSANVLKYHIKSKIMDKSMTVLTIRVFQREIMMAKACVRLKELQDQFISDLQIGVENNDVMILNQLIIKSDKLDLKTHPLVQHAKSLLSKLNEKRNVIKKMIAFLENETDDDIHKPDKQKKESKKSRKARRAMKAKLSVSDEMKDYYDSNNSYNYEDDDEEYDEDDEEEDDDDDDLYGQSSKMNNLLAKARELGVDRDFIAKVDRVYISVGPRIESRALLRRAIETVDRYGILKGIKEVESLQIHHPNFANIEVRSGNTMLRLLDFDRQLTMSLLSSVTSPTHTPKSEGSSANSSVKSGQLRINDSVFIDGEDDDDLLELKPIKPKSPDRNSVTKPPQPPSPKGTSVNTNNSNSNNNNTINTNVSAKTLIRGDIADESESPRLTKELIELCDEISLLTAVVQNAKNSFYPDGFQKEKSRLKELKQQLKNYAKTPIELETIIRSYKWTKLLCPWKFPEITGKSSSASISSPPKLLVTIPSSSKRIIERKDESFYGLNITEARSSVYLIKLLHREIDPVVGDVPASLQAGMGGLNLPYAVTSALKELDEVNRYNQSRKQYAMSITSTLNSSNVSGAMNNDTTNRKDESMSSANSSHTKRSFDGTNTNQMSNNSSNGGMDGISTKSQTPPTSSSLSSSGKSKKNTTSPRPNDKQTIDWQEQLLVSRMNLERQKETLAKTKSKLAKAQLQKKWK